MRATKNDVMAKLVFHIGAADGIRAADLARELDITERRLRHLITDLIEEDGIGICGHPSTGYYVARTPEELEATIEFHKTRALHELHKASRLSKIPLPDLVGQLKLRT